MNRLQYLFFIGLFGINTACLPKNTGSSLLGGNSIANEIPKNTAKVSFKKTKIPSIDAVFTEAAQLDSSFVIARNQLQRTRKSLHSLRNGNLSLQAEIAQLIANGTFRMTRVNGEGRIYHNTDKKTARSTKLFNGLNHLQRSYSSIKKELPRMSKNLKELVQKSERLKNRAPTEIQTAVSNGTLRPLQINNTLLKARHNLDIAQRIPVHLTEVRTELKRSNNLLRKLMGLE